RTHAAKLESLAHLRELADLQVSRPFGWIAALPRDTQRVHSFRRAAHTRRVDLIHRHLVGCHWIGTELLHEHRHRYQLALLDDGANPGDVAWPGVVAALTADNHPI